ncbi:MAG: RluA family pseudouridine synthase [Dehalococcoidia bacterium]
MPQGSEGELEELLLEEEFPTTRELVAEEEGERLDSFLARREPELSRSRLQQLIQEGLITVNDRLAKRATRVRAGDWVLLTMPPPEPVGLEPEVVPLEVVYQDEELMVVEKPPGLPVHPGPGHPAHTLVNGLLALCPDLKGIGGELRPGIVHRLDKDTSGLLVVAKTQRAHQHLSAQLKERRVSKGYTTLVTGRLAQEEGLIEAPIGRDPRDRKRLAVVPGGREASTRYQVLQYLNQYTLVEAFPLTGRTHQIRVHFASLGHPLLGDPLYGRASPVLGRQFLHAHYLGFHHPVSGEWLEFRSPLPPDLQWALAAVEAGV